MQGAQDELIDLALAPVELPILGDEPLTQGPDVEFVEVGRENYARIMPQAHPCGHPVIPRWGTVRSFESHRHPAAVARAAPAPARRTGPGRA